MDSITTLSSRMYSPPPEAQTRLETNPTLLVSWWATGFSLAIILVRVCGRYIRTERLFADDWIMVLSIVPLLIRMGFVHMVLIWGTNNAIYDGLSEQDIANRELGSRMVLGARIFYALFIWTAKFTVAEFLRRLTAQIWRRSFQWALEFIRYFLAVTFVAVVIATLTECQPFTHYWQVVPDPGPKCRQGYAQLITMGTCDVITDLLLVIFPVPIIRLSALPAKRKVSLTFLFGLSVILIVITCYRVPSVISRNGSQQYRSLIASLEILAAAAVSNAIVIGSFVRDRGLKKRKFKGVSFSESIEQTYSRRATVTHHHWGSDADLANDVGIRLDSTLQSPGFHQIRPAPVALPNHHAKHGSIDPNWQFSPTRSNVDDDRTSTTDSSGGLKAHPHEYIETNIHPSTHDSRSVPTSNRGYGNPSKISLIDVGGLLDHRSRRANDIRVPPASHQPSSPFSDQPQSPNPPRSRNLLQAVGELLSPSNAGTGGIKPPDDSLLHRPVGTAQNFSRPTTSTRPAYDDDPSPSSSSLPGQTGGTLGASWANGQREDGAIELNTVPQLRDEGGLLVHTRVNNTQNTSHNNPF